MQGGQVNDDKFELLTPPEVRKLIKRYEESDPERNISPSEAPSTLQVSATRGKLITDSNPARISGWLALTGRGPKGPYQTSETFKSAGSRRSEGTKAQTRTHDGKFAGGSSDRA